jgi:prolyl 4-hydroxylase
MPNTVSFPAQVRDWIAHNLSRGAQPAAIVQELIAHGSVAEVAGAMVDAVSAALLYCTELPGDLLELGVPPVTYRIDPWHVPDGARIRLGDHETRALLRLQRPAAVLLDGFLSDAECAALIALAQPRLTRSTVVDPVTGRDVVANHRSSDGMFFRRGETELIERIETRIARLTGHPSEHGEGLQMLHYETGAESTPHVDYLRPGNEANRASISRSGQRVGTLLMYLNDVEAGGETVFPQCGWSVAPRRGQAFYFEYSNRQGQCDPLSLHASLPVRAGDKWVATKWIRAQRFMARGEAPEKSMR